MISIPGINAGAFRTITANSPAMMHFNLSVKFSGEACLQKPAVSFSESAGEDFCPVQASARRGKS